MNIPPFFKGILKSNVISDKSIIINFLLEFRSGCDSFFFGLNASACFCFPDTCFGIDTNPVLKSHL